MKPWKCRQIRVNRLELLYSGVDDNGELIYDDSVAELDKLDEIKCCH